MDQISYDDFAKIDIRVGRIVQADLFPQARKPAYRLANRFRGCDWCEEFERANHEYYDPRDLVGKLVLGVVNFRPVRSRRFFSEVLTLGVILGEGHLSDPPRSRRAVGRSDSLSRPPRTACST